MRRANDANRDFSQAIALKPGHAQAYFARGLSFHMIGRKQSAEADYRHVLQIDPKHKGARRALKMLDRGGVPRGGPTTPKEHFKPPKVKI